MERVECVVIGAGVVGLAIAQEIARTGREVVILEAEKTIGSGISSRNSEVIHAGMYYPPGSVRARLCVRGNQLLRHFAAEYGVAHSMVGKLIVAHDHSEVAKLHQILDRAKANGVHGLREISPSEAMEMEPNLFCHAALLSPDTGIVDTHGLMLALQGQAEQHGAMIAFASPVQGGQATPDGFVLQVGGDYPSHLLAKCVVIAAGLQSCPLGRALGLANVPQNYLCKGNYFTLTGKMPFQKLIYPVPVAAGLGTHYTVDLAGRGRFGPDVEWIEQEDYLVNPRRADQFYAAIRRYWPALPDDALEPAYAGIRPKIHAQHEEAADFTVHGPNQHGVPGLIALYGIESPGLTSSLAIAEWVSHQISTLHQ
jgi:L-2-hydroxyglutarate oxidase LhgO